MANKHNTLSSLFKDIADAIRAKEKSTGKIVADDFPTRISAIKGGATAVFWEGNKEKDDTVGLIYTTDDASVTGEKVISPGTVSGEKLIID